MYYLFLTPCYLNSPCPKSVDRTVSQHKDDRLPGHDLRYLVELFSVGTKGAQSVRYVVEQILHTDGCALDINSVSDPRKVEKRPIFIPMDPNFFNRVGFIYVFSESGFIKHFSYVTLMFCKIFVTRLSLCFTVQYFFSHIYVH